MKFYGEIRGGKILLSHPDLFKRRREELDGQTIQMSLDKRKDSRTLRQNNFYWGYIAVISRESGHSKAALHNYFKKEFIAPEYEEVYGKLIEIDPTTTTLGKKAEFSAYIERIHAHTEIPPPSPEYFDL